MKIELVLGILAIGKAMAPAMKSLSKVKKPAWGAMKGAVQSVGSSLNPMQQFGHALKFASILMKPIGMLFKVLGNAIIKKAMPAIMSFIAILTDPTHMEYFEELGYMFGTVLKLSLEGFVFALRLLAPVTRQLTQFLRENNVVMIYFTTMLKAWIFVIMGAINAVKIGISWIHSIGSTIIIVFRNVRNGIKSIFNGIIGFINNIINGINNLFGTSFGTVPSLATGGNILQSGLVFAHRNEKIIPAKTAPLSGGGGEIHIHIDLRNAIVDNRDKLIRQIGEQVLMRIG